MGGALPMLGMAPVYPWFRAAPCPSRIVLYAIPALLLSPALVDVTALRGIILRWRRPRWRATRF